MPQNRCWSIWGLGMSVHLRPAFGFYLILGPLEVFWLREAEPDGLYADPEHGPIVVKNCEVTPIGESGLTIQEWESDIDANETTEGDQTSTKGESK